MNLSFGSKKKSSSGTERRTGIGIQTEQLKLDEAAIQKIIEDVLGGPQGLASIFQGEQTAGIFDSTVAAQAAGDLAANLVGEIAKLTGVREIRREEDTTIATTGKTREKDSSFGFDLFG